MADIAKLDLSIDENELAEEWKHQASLALEYGIELADAMQEEDEAKAELAVVTAEIDRSIRDHPQKYGLPKLTDTAVMNTIPIQEEHQDAVKRYSDAKHRTQLCWAAVNAISARKASLQGMTDLFMRQWYAEPKSSEQPDNSGPPTQPQPGRRKRRASKDEE